MKALREALLLLFVAAVPAALAIIWHPELAERARAGLPDDAVLATEVARWPQQVLWVDARAPDAFALGHVPGAVSFDETNFSASIGLIATTWAPEIRIVVYCDSSACTRSRELAQRLREAGFGEVYYLHGGWDAWIAAHAPQ